MKGLPMPIKLVTDVQNKIKKMLARNGINVKVIAEMTHLPYSTVRDSLNIAGRLNISWLNWYADYFGTTTDYLLARDKPDKIIGENFQFAREHAGLSLKAAQEDFGTTVYALNAIETGEMDAPLLFLRKAVDSYHVPSDFILGVAEQSMDTEIITALFRDIKFLLICQDIHRNNQLRRLFTILRGLSDNELIRLTKVIEHLVNEWILAPLEKEKIHTD